MNDCKGGLGYNNGRYKDRKTEKEKERMMHKKAEREINRKLGNTGYADKKTCTQEMWRITE